VRLPRAVTEAARDLARYCPTDRPVRVEVVPRLRWYGDTSIHRDVYLIRVAGDMDRGLYHDIMAHEWAHAMAWHASRIDHGEAWGRAYSRCYRVAVEGWRPKR